MIANKIEIGSDNVFKDLGDANPEERLAKSELVQKINAIIKKNKWTQARTAKVVGIPQPKVSLLSKGIVSGFSLGKLMTILNKLDQDIDIVIHEKKTTKKTGQNIVGHIRVVYAAKPIDEDNT